MKRVKSRRGSSPLTRGKRAQVGRHRVPGGLIPAHAGKTQLPNSILTNAWAHPRSRGENSGLIRASFWYIGSSPLTRGKRALETREAQAARLIPAHAGKTRKSMPYAGVVQAHPRSRGENYRRKPFFLADDGSSPLTRGKPDAPRVRVVIPRLIPAHAGKTAITSAYKHSVAAHPRSRGENTS